MPEHPAAVDAYRRIGPCLLACAGLGNPAFAAHHLQTEDTGTQGTGNVEIENGLSRKHAGGAAVLLYELQLSYGLTPELDLIAQPSWQREPGRRGLGDANLDAKWRFFDAAPWSLGLRAGLAVPMDRSGLGLPHGTMAAHGLLVATYDEAPWTVHANVGLDRNPAASGLRRNLYRASAAVMWAARDGLVWTLDAGVSADPDPRRHHWPATLLAGVVYTVSPGLEVDLGYQASAGARPSARQWLAGLTYRFAR